MQKTEIILQFSQSFREVLLQPCGTPSAEILIQLGILPHLLLEAPDMGKISVLRTAEQRRQVTEGSRVRVLFLGAHGEQPLLGEHHVGECVVGIR